MPDNVTLAFHQKMMLLQLKI